MKYNLLIGGIAFLLGQNMLASEELTSLRQEFHAHYHSILESRLGKIHYEDIGDKSAPTVLLVHGVSGPLSVWDKTVDELVGKGYRVIRFDLFGRGFSERLDCVNYGLPTYLNQVEELVDSLDLKTPFSIVGSSLGAVISTEYTLQHPEKVAGIILIGPAGFPISVPPIAKLRGVPLLGDLIFKAFGRQTILKQNKKYFVDENPPADFWHYFTGQLEIPGTAEAMRLTMNNAPAQTFVDSYEKLGILDIPVGVIWGRQDITFPYSNHETLLRAIPKAHLVTIENAGHIPQYERAIETNHALLNHLERFRKSEASKSLSPRLSYPPELNLELNSTPVENSSLFEDPFFRSENATLQSLELAPGITKNYQFPTLYNNVTTSIAMFTCDYEAAAKLIKNDAVRPISIGLNRAIVTLTSYRYNQVRGILPYNEVAVSILVRRKGDSTLSETLSLEKLKTFEAYVVSMPVTSLENKVRGREIWGLPKEVHPIELRQMGNDFVTTVYSEAGQTLFRFSVPMLGKPVQKHQTLTIHSVLNNTPLIASTKSAGKFFTTTNLQALVINTGASRLEIGRHSNAEWLKGLNISPEPIHTGFSFGTKNSLTLPFSF